MPENNTAAPKASPAELPDAVAHYGGVFTDEQLGMKPAPLQQGEYLPLPKRRRRFLCTKCGSEQCKDGAENMPYPPCNKCNYLGFAEDCDFNDEEMHAYVDADRAARGAAQAAPAKHMVIDWPLYNKDPVPEMDDIYADYSKSFGITPGPVMAKIVQRHQARLQSWFGGHREAIRSALVAQAAPAPVAEDAERWREFQKGKPLVVKMAKSTVIYGPNHEREFPDALNKAVDHARAQTAQPEGGA